MSGPHSVSRVLLVGAFLAVSSSAGLQWVGLTVQAEALRQQVSRRMLAEFSAVLNQYEVAPTTEKPAVAEHLTGMAERLSKNVRGETLASASRRVVALASYEDGRESSEKELRDRLRAEVRGLMNEAESLESAALGRANVLSGINQALLIAAALFCGLLLFPLSRTSSPA